MIPKLYKQDETNYNHNGIAQLVDTLKYEVTEGLNGEFELYLEYPSSGKWTSEITDFRTLRVKPNDDDDLHNFRIYDVVESLEDEIVYVYATTKTNDLGGNVAKLVDMTGTAQQVLTRLKSQLVYPTDMNFVSDMDTVSTVFWERRNPLNCIIGEEGSLIQIFGGEIKRTDDTIYVYSRRGRDNVMTVRQGRHIEGFRRTTSTKGLITGILPYFKYYPEGSENEVTIEGSIVNSPLINNYPVRNLVPIDYSGDEEIQSKADLDRVAATYFTTQNPDSDKPSVKLEINLVQLSDSPDYERFKHLEHVRLGDTITVWVPKYRVNVTVKVTNLVYNGLGEKVVSLTAGSPSTGFYDEVKNSYQQDIRHLRTYVEGMENGVRNIIQISTDGKNRIFRGYTEPPQDISKENDIWFKLLGNGREEIFVFDGAFWQPMVIEGFDSIVRARVQTMMDEAEAEKARVNQEFENVMDETQQYVDQKTQEINEEFTLINGQINDVMTNADWSRSQINATIAGSGFTSLDQIMTDVRNISNSANEIALQGVEDAAEAMARAQDALAEYRNMEIGGRNLLRNTSFNQGFEFWGGSANNHLVDDSPIPGVKAVELFDYNNLHQTLNGVDTQTYTFSFWVKIVDNPNNSSYQFRVISQGGTVASGDNITSTNGVWQKHTLTRRGLNFNEIRFRGSGSINHAGGIVRVAGFKVEHGTKASDWSPAPEDVQVQITDINGELQRKVSQTVFNDLNTSFEAIQSITYQNQHDIGLKASAQLVNSINQTVENHTAQINTNAYEIQQRATQQSVNNLTGRVTTAEASIITNATQIGLRATQSSVDTINSQINNIFAEFTVQSDRINSKVSMAEVNGALDVLDYENRNLIIRNDELPGAYVANDGIWGELWTRRMIHYIPVQPGERLTLTKNSGFHDNSWRLSYYDSDKNWISRYTSASDRITFTIPNNIYLMRASYPADAQVKLERGTRATPWSLAPEDTKASIVHVESDLTQTAEEFRLAIIQVNTGLDGKASLQAFNTLDQTVGSTVGRIGDAEGRLNSVESTANGTQQIVSGTNGLVTQISSISAGFDVLAQRSVQNILNNPRFENGMSGWTRGNEVVLENTSGDGHVFGVWNANGQRNGERRIWVNGDNISDPVDLDRQGKSYNVRIKFRLAAGANPRMQFGQGNGAYFETITANGGTTVTKTFAFTATGNQTFSIYFLDNGYYRIEEVVITETGGATQGQLSVLNNAIDLAVSEGDVISRINAQANRILIQSNQLVLSAASVIFSGSAFIPNASILELNANKLTGTEADFGLTRTRVLIANAVQATHIQASNATIDKIFGTTALINQLTSKSAFINNIQAIDISASRITTGTLNGNNMNVLNINVSSLVGNTTNFVTTNWNNASGYVMINGTGIHFTETLNGSTLSYSLISTGLRFRSGNQEALLRFNGTNYVLDTNLGLYGNHINSVHWLRLANSNTHLQSHPSQNGGALIDSSQIVIGLGDRDNFTNTAHFSTNIGFYRNVFMQGNALNGVGELNLQNSTGSFAHSIGQIGGSVLMDGAAITIGIRSGSGLSFSRRAEFTGRIDFYRNLWMNGNTVGGDSDERLKDGIVSTEQDSLSIIEDLWLTDFYWKHPDYYSQHPGKQFGLIAQRTDRSLVMYDEKKDIYGIDINRLGMTTAHGLQQLAKKHDNTLAVASRALWLVEDLGEDVDTLKQDMEIMKDKMTKMQVKLDKLEGAA